MITDCPPAAKKATPLKKFARAIFRMGAASVDLNTERFVQTRRDEHIQLTIDSRSIPCFFIFSTRVVLFMFKNLAARFLTQ